MFDSIFNHFADLHYTRELGSKDRVRAWDANGHGVQMPEYVVVDDIDDDVEEVVVDGELQVRQIQRRTLEFEAPREPGFYWRFQIDEGPKWAVERLVSHSDVGNLTTFHLKRPKPKRMRMPGVER